MLHELNERFYRPGCTEAVRDWCMHTCIRCTTRKTTAPKRQSPLQTLRAAWVSDANSMCQYHGTPSPETEDRFKYVHVAADCFTRWVECMEYPIKRP